MNNDLEQLSEERLMQMERALSIGSLDDRPTMDEMLKITRIALSAKQAKPVAWEVKGILCHTKEEANIFIGEPEPLYDTPQPAHTEPDGWIKCSERMPVNDNPVKTSNGVDVGKAWWDGDNWMSWPQDTIADEITHWMPLPAAPKLESE